MGFSSPEILRSAEASSSHLKIVICPSIKKSMPKYAGMVLGLKIWEGGVEVKSGELHLPPWLIQG